MFPEYNQASWLELGKPKRFLWVYEISLGHSKDVLCNDTWLLAATPSEVGVEGPAGLSAGPDTSGHLQWHVVTVAATCISDSGVGRTYSNVPISLGNCCGLWFYTSLGNRRWWNHGSCALLLWTISSNVPECWLCILPVSERYFWKYGPVHYSLAEIFALVF